MRSRHVVVSSLLVLLCLSARADEPAVSIGDHIKSLEFKDIRYLPRSLDELGKHKAFVFAFTNTTCPLVQRYLPRLKSLHKEFAPLGVQFVAVNVGSGDTIQDMAAHALENGVPFPFVKDLTGQCARSLGVERTPEVAVLDHRHRLVYRGRIDDQYRFGGALPKPRQENLRAALQDILASRPVAVPTTPVDGCLLSFPAAPSPEENDITFTEHAAPLLKRHCVPCHRAGTAAPFSLITYEDVSRQSRMIAEVVTEQRMPPWYASARYGHFQNDRSMTSKERRTLLRWIRGGLKTGPPSDQPSTEAIVRQSTWQIGKPDLILQMLVPDQLPAEGFIPYRYSVFPHVFLQDTWIEAIEIRPDNRRVVHHANLAYGSPGRKPGHETFITGYVPGGQAMNLTHFDNGVSFRIPALSVLGLQIHYVTTGRKEQCRISVGIRFARKTVKKRLHHRLMDPHGFRIPPGHPAWPVRESTTLDSDVTLLGLFTHMHVRGKDMTFFAHHPDGRKETLLQIPNFSFDWQQAYEIQAGEKRLPNGTRLEAVAHYDNSPFNPYNPDPGSTVRYGPQTVHEMMNGYVFFTVDSENLNLKIDPATGWRIPPVKKPESQGAVR